jgi:hypothetical protein
MKRLAFLIAVSVFVAGCGNSDPSRKPATDPKPAERTVSTLKPEIRDEVATLVRAGFYNKNRIMEILCEEIYTQGELNPTDVSAAIDEELARLQAEKKTWPAVTDCDRLDAAFAAMNRRGVIALQNAGYTQTDGYEDFRAALEKHPRRSSVIGYCFYQGQDLERAIHGEGLFLAFGPVDPRDEEVKGSGIGKVVREELERAGLKVEWDGTFATRLRVPRLVWQRR